MSRSLRAVTFAATLALTAHAFAQPAFDLTVGGSLAALDEAGFGRSTRGLAHAALDFEQRFDDAHGRVGYALAAATYATEGDWRSLLHTAELVYRIDLAAEERGRLFLGASGSLRDNGDAWGQADYRAFGLMANSAWRLGAHATLRAGYRFDLRRFPDLAALDQEQHDGFASLLVNLPSRTTLIGEAHVGVKAYDGGTLTLTLPAEDGATTSPHGGRGRGAGSLGPGVRPTVITLADASHAHQVNWLVRAAQSLRDRTGLSLQYARRSTSGRVPPALVTTPAGFFDDGVYDDPFASDARAGRAALKHVFAGGATLEAWGLRLERDFSATPALGLDGLPLPAGELRRDRVWRAGAGLRLPLGSGRAGALRLALDLGYDFTDHRSNDVYYDYRSHAAGVALRLAY
jgi:hypothetical protein